MDLIVYALCRKYAKKLVQGLGALRGSPAKITKIEPVYSTLDPTKVIQNKITFKYQGNPGVAASVGIPVVWEQKILDVMNGRGIYSIEYKSNTAEWIYYDVKMLDGSVQEMKIPVNSGSMQLITVTALPIISTAKDNAIYLLQDSVNPSLYYKYIKTIKEDGVNFQWVLIGTTQTDLSGYVKKVEPTIIKQYKDYDPDTAETRSHSVIGAINTHEKELGANYDDVTGKITNLLTLHRDNLIDVANEHGDLRDLEMYDAVTGKPETLVEAINMANKDYEIENNLVVNRTKFVDTYRLTKDAGDGSPIGQAGDTIEIPRVELTQKTVPDTGDFRTYDMTMASELSDPDDTTNKPYGAVHIPSIKIKKIEPVTDPSLASEYFLSIEGAQTWDEGVAGAKIQLQKDLVIKDAGVKKCETAGVPLPTLAVGD